MIGPLMIDWVLNAFFGILCLIFCGQVEDQSGNLLLNDS